MAPKAAALRSPRPGLSGRAAPGRAGRGPAEFGFSKLPRLGGSTKLPLPERGQFATPSVHHYPSGIRDLGSQSTPKPNPEPMHMPKRAPGVSFYSSSLFRPRKPRGRRRSPGALRGPTMEDDASAARIKAYKIAVEYRYMRAHAPGGIYVVPSLNDIRHWHGVIFVRRGPYANGIFKFSMQLPEDYPEAGAAPVITFATKVYNPLVNADTGVVNLGLFIPEWDPAQHFVITALTTLKRIFYFRLQGDASKRPLWLEDPSKAEDAAAARLAKADPAAFLANVEACVVRSQRRVHDEAGGLGIRFPSIEEGSPAEAAVSGLALSLFDVDSGSRVTRHASTILEAVKTPPPPPSEDDLHRMREAEAAADAAEPDLDWEPTLPAFFWDCAPAADAPKAQGDDSFGDADDSFGDAGEAPGPAAALRVL